MVGLSWIYHDISTAYMLRWKPSYKMLGEKQHVYEQVSSMAQVSTPALHHVTELPYAHTTSRVGVSTMAWGPGMK